MKAKKGNAVVRLDVELLAQVRKKVDKSNGVYRSITQFVDLAAREKLNKEAL